LHVLSDPELTPKSSNP